MKLTQNFYQRNDTIEMAKELIGHFLYTKIDGELTGGMIVETEAYMGVTDSSCHTFNNRKTNRNATMYNRGGVIYMYVCYGIHDMLNIVTGNKGDSQVILIRAIEPLTGIEIMKKRRGDVPLKKLAKGPGSLAKALGLKRIHDGISLIEDNIWIEDQGFKVESENMIETPRIGLGCAEPYFSMPWRFFLKGNGFVSGKINFK